MTIQKKMVFLPITSKIKLTMKSLIIREEFFQPIKYILSIDMYCVFFWIVRNVIWIPTWPVWPPLIHLICTTYVSSNFEQDDTWYVIPNIKMTTIYLICFSRQEEEIFSMTCHRTTKPNYNETETILNPNLNVYSAEISQVFI